MTDYLTEAKDKVEAYLATHEIPTYFYSCFFGELVKVFGIEFLIPDLYYDSEYDDEGERIPYDEADYSYKDQIDYFLTCYGGTGGWGLAFEEACKQCDLLSLYEDYSNFDWVHSDIFDGYITDNMMETVFENDISSNYYLFKLKRLDYKEN